MRHPVGRVPALVATIGRRALLRAMVWLVLCGSAGLLPAQNAITLDPVTIQDLGGAEGIVRIDSDAPVASIFLSIEYDPLVVTPGAVTATGSAAAAEGVFPNILASVGGLVAGVILDVQPPFDGQTIAPGSDLAILSVEWIPVAAIPAGSTTTPLTFIDGVFDSPPVTNTINQAGGVAVTATTGLILTGTQITLEEPTPPTLRLDPLVIGPADPPLPLTVRLDNSAGPISAFSLVLVEPSLLEVSAVELGGSILELVGIESLVTDFSGPDLLVEGVLDSDPPFDGQTIPVGGDQVLLHLMTSCTAPPLEPAPSTSVVFDWSMTTASSVTTGAGVVPATTVGTTVECLPLPLLTASYHAGVETTPATIGSISAAPGDTITMGIFYTDPGEGVNGLTIALCVDCSLANFVPGSVTAIGDALDEAEFVQPDFDIDPNDGDGCEWTLGALLDFNPPFDGAILPFTSEPSRLCRLDIAIDPAAPSGASIDVAFCDGINGSGGALLANSLIVGTESFSNFERVDGEITLDAGTPFRRGDFDGDGALNIADPISTLQYLFAGGVAPECTAAADIDASGDLQINDPIALLGFLFVAGPPPAPPFPDCGVSPTEECAMTDACP